MGVSLTWIGVTLNSLKMAARSFFKLGNARNEYRIIRLREIEDNLLMIKPEQPRPRNHICVKRCYKLRKNVQDIATVERIESAHELISRNTLKKYYNELHIEEMIDAVRKEILDIEI